MKTFLEDFYQKKIFGEKKNQIWEIYWLLFDIEFEKVVWFIYKKSFLNFESFLFEDITWEYKNWFTIKINTSKTEYYEIIWKKVLNEEWQNLWTIEDIEFDDNNKLKFLIIDWWYNFSGIKIINKTKIKVDKDIRKISKENILSYEKDYILIKDKEFIKENKKTLENISKIFINIESPSYNINQ